MLLQELDDRIAYLYAAIAGPSLVLYAVSILLPIFWPDTPFKSPLIPSFACLVGWCTVGFWLITLYTVTAASALVLASFRAGMKLSRLDPRQRATKSLRLTAGVSHIIASLRLRVATVHASLISQTRDFWTEQETRRLRVDPDDAAAVLRSMDDFGDALAQAPQIIRRRVLGRVRPC